MASGVDDLGQDLKRVGIHDLDKNVETPVIKAENPFKRVIRNNHRAKDITKEFTRASNALDVSELVRDETFSLFDSVQALEIMDPKMDTGFLLPGESLEDDYDVSRKLQPEEVIGIMDQLLSYEMSWQQGYPLAQNLFSSLYIDSILAQKRERSEFPKFTAATGSSDEAGPLVHLVLMAYCIGVIKSCDITIEMIQSQQYYEEEDFNTHTFNRNMLTDLDDDHCLKMLMEAEEWLTSQTEISEEITEALILRLRTRRDLYDVILPTFAAALTEENWTDVKARLRNLVVSHGMGRTVEDAFSPKVQRRLASTVPPRPITDLKFEEACQNLLNLCEDTREALSISAEGPLQNPEHLLTLLWVYSARQPQPSTLARAILQSQLFSDGCVADAGGIQMLLWKMVDDVLPNGGCYMDEAFWNVEDPADQRYRCARAVDFFIEQATHDYGNALRILCQNRCRIRRSFANVVRDLDSLQESLVSAYFPPGSDNKDADWPLDYYLKWNILLVADRFGSWILESIHRLGFEEDIYQVHELPHMYHILAEQMSARTGTIANRRLLTRQILNPSIRKLLPLGIIDRVDVDTTDKGMSFDFECSTTRAVFATTLAYLHIVLSALGAGTLAQSQTPYGLEMLQWEARMRPSSNLSFGRGVGKMNTYLERRQDFSHTPLLASLSTAQKDITLANTWFKSQLSEARGSLKGRGPSITAENYENKEIQDAYRACLETMFALGTLKKAAEKYAGDLGEMAKHVNILHGHLRVGCWIVPKVALK